MITRNEFRVLCAVKDQPGMTQRELADALGISLGTVNNVCRALGKAKLIEDGAITERGMKELAPFRVENAVIMAAGMSTRFAPVTIWDVP